MDKTNVAQQSLASIDKNIKYRVIRKQQLPIVRIVGKQIIIIIS